jgi:hypothetical protein
MKKLIPILLVGILVLSGLGAATSSNNSTENTVVNIKNETMNMEITRPTFSQQDEFVTINLDQSETFMSHSGEPMLPVISKTFNFPIGTIIDDVQVDINWERYDLDCKVTPTPVIMPLSGDIDSIAVEEMSFNEDIYESTALYPSEPYSVQLGAGIQDMEHVIFVNVKCYPQYSPANDVINIPTNIDIDIAYEAAEDPEPTAAEQYDMIIVTHDLFKDDLQPLVEHKESLGITTKLVTVDEIYNEYDGAGDFEEIKMYLADHVLDWDTKFVLLAGGHKGQTDDWYVPDFRSHNWNPADAYDPPYDETYSADLYYADLYRINQYGQSVFDSWDTNENGIYGEGPTSPTGVDAPDFYPDVYLGRIPFRYTWEVPVAVNKIIDYENNADDSWYKKAVLCGGDGFPTERYPGQAIPDVKEGEIVCDAFADLLSNKGFESTKCYLSHEGDVYVEEARDVYDVINSQGAGWVHMTGHASPFILGSYHPNVFPLIAFYTGLNVKNFQNEGKLPFMINEGCHNAEFDVTTQELITGFLTNDPNVWVTFSREEWIHHDASSWFLLHKGGGAIGVIGNTALGLGGLNYGCTEFVGGWIMLKFAEAYGLGGEEYTGSVWTYGINGYINTFDVMGDTGDRKTIEERVLLGDPSVKLGGYKSTLSDEEQETTNEPEYGPVSVNAPTWNVGDSWTYSLDNIDLNLNPDPEVGRSIELKLSMGDIVMEVTDETSTSYVSSITSDDVDVTFGGMFDFHVAGQDNIAIPTITLDNAQIDGVLVVDKDNLGIEKIELRIIVDIVENLDNLKDVIGINLPGFINIISPFISIPANIDLTVQFDKPYDLLQFPLENKDYWSLYANTVTVSIGGSVESVWLRILDVINNFIPIIPEQFAQYLPNVDIGEVLNDLGIDTTYTLDLPDIDLNTSFKTKTFEVLGSENVNVPAGTFNAAKISVLEDNLFLYYSESEQNVVKVIGFLSDYIPIVDDISIELKE